MKMRLIFLLIITAAIFSGCVTGSHTVTGTARPAIAANRVTLYSQPPAKFETIGTVYADSEISGQSGADKAISRLKSEAGKIGANGIILSENIGSVAGLWSHTATRYSATAIFVP